MSVLGGKAEDICLSGAFQLLDPKRTQFLFMSTLREQAEDEPEFVGPPDVGSDIRPVKNGFEN